jgi:hypothetical protein
MLNIQKVTGYNFHSFPVEGEGTAIILTDSKGRTYTMCQFVTARQAQVLQATIFTRGYIDLAYWDFRVPYGVMAWLEDGYEAIQIIEERGYI